jgi:hypothetical protein
MQVFMLELQEPYEPGLKTQQGAGHLDMDCIDG